MQSGTEPGIVSVDRLEGSLVVAFSDGRCALYPASLLHALLPDDRVRVLEEAEEQEQGGSAE